MNEREVYCKRVAAIIPLLVAGAKSKTLVKRFTEKWNCSERTVYRCIKRAKKLGNEKLDRKNLEFFLVYPPYLQKYLFSIDDFLKYCESVV